MMTNRWIEQTLKAVKRRRHHQLILEAIRHLGSMGALARASGLSTSQISRLLWMQRGVTAEVAVALERATRGKITRRMLLPEIFQR